MRKKSSFSKYAVVLMVAATTTAFVAEIPVQAQTNSFIDVKEGYTHYNAIISLNELGIMKGVTSTEFKPNAEVKRGEAAQYIVNALNFNTENVQNPGFTDVSTSNPYYKAIAVLYENDVISGYNDGTFRPNNTLTRSQIAKMLTLSFNLNEATTTLTKFTDVNKLSDKNTIHYIQTLVNYGITTGTTQTTYSPNMTLKRGQLATFLYRAMDSNGFEIIGVE